MALLRMQDRAGNIWNLNAEDIQKWRAEGYALQEAPRGQRLATSAESQAEADEHARAARRAAIVADAAPAPASAELDELKRQIAELRELLEVKPTEPAPASSELDKMTLEQLHSYASENAIDLEGATLKSDVLAKLKAAQAAQV